MSALFKMTEADLAGIIARIKAARSAPMIALQCGPPPSVQQAANDAWADLGARMGFDPKTVKPSRLGDRFFTAEPASIDRAASAHLGDPCIFCGTAHDDVEPGPCPAQPPKGGA